MAREPTATSFELLAQSTSGPGVGNSRQECGCHFAHQHTLLDTLSSPLGTSGGYGRKV